MKIIDRYILRTFFVPFLYCILAFELIYIVFDLFDNLPDFLDAKAPVLEVVQFYLILLPSSIVYIVPVSLLLAVLYSLAQFTRHNELTAMRASGVDLYRLMAPFVYVGIFSSIAVGLINETVAPWSLYKTDQLIDLYRSHGNEAVFVENNLPYKNIDGRRIWMVNKFNTRTHEMQGINIIQQRPDNSDEAKIEAERGEWKDGKLWLYDLEQQDYTREGRPDGPPQLYDYREMTDYDETPQGFLNERKDPEYLSAAQIQHFIDTHNLEQSIVTRLKVDKHYRLAIPWTCLIVTMLGIPFGAHTGRRGAMAGVALILGLFLVYYSLIYICLGLGKNGYIDTLQACWTPHAVFFCVALFMTARMR